MSHPHETIHESDGHSTLDDCPIIPTAMAEEAEEILREFAREAELDMVLIVDRDASLIAGISSEENVSTDRLTALVAGAGKAVKALVRELGETGALESLHQGDDRLIYLRELAGHLILVGVSSALVPAGIIRRQAAPVRAKLTDLFKDISLPEKSESNDRVQRSLRITGMFRDSNGPSGDKEKDDEAGSNRLEETELPPALEEETPPPVIQTEEKEEPVPPEVEDKKPVLVEEELESPIPVKTIPSNHPEIPAAEQREDSAEKSLDTDDPLDFLSDLDFPSAEEPERSETPRAAPIVVDSPFEAVLDSVENVNENVEEELPVNTEEEEGELIIADGWGGAAADIEIIDESEPTSTNGSNPQELSGGEKDADTELSGAGDQEVPEPSAAASEHRPPVQTGPKYSYDFE